MQQQQSNQQQPKIQTNIDEQLIEASKILNLNLIQQLVKAGANVNYIKHTNINGWYSGDTHSALYTAVNSDFSNSSCAKNYLDVVQFLLQHGADASFQAVRGNWNHCTSYPVFSRIANILNKLKIQDDKIRLIQMMAKYKVDLNQQQYHQRSKGWRAYQTKTCLLFHVMDSCGVKSRLRQIQKIYLAVDVKQIKDEKNRELKAKFYKQFPQYSPKQIDKTEQVKDGNIQVEKLNKQTKLILLLLSLGVNSNSENSYFYWQNYTSNYEEQDQMLMRLSEKRVNTYQSALHRAIMNDCVDVVKFLLQKGAKVSTKYQFSTKLPVYPNEWPEKYKQQKLKQVKKTLSEYENYKMVELKRLAMATSQEDKRKIWKDIQNCDFEIYKAKVFAIENECPAEIDEPKQITCVELAEVLDVSKEIIDLLKMYEQKQQKQEKVPA